MLHSPFFGKIISCQRLLMSFSSYLLYLEYILESRQNVHPAANVYVLPNNGFFDYVNGAINYAGCLSSRHDATGNEIDTRLAPSALHESLCKSREDFTRLPTCNWTLLIKVNLKVNSLEIYDFKVVLFNIIL